MWVLSWIGKMPWSRKWQPAPVFLLGKFHDQQSLVCSSPWDHKESDMTEWLSIHTEPLSFYHVWLGGSDHISLDKHCVPAAQHCLFLSRCSVNIYWVSVVCIPRECLTSYCLNSLLLFQAFTSTLSKFTSSGLFFQEFKKQAFILILGHVNSDF